MSLLTTADTEALRHTNTDLSRTRRGRESMFENYTIKIAIISPETTTLDLLTKEIFDLSQTPLENTKIMHYMLMICF